MRTKNRRSARAHGANEARHRLLKKRKRLCRELLAASIAGALVLAAGCTASRPAGAPAAVAKAAEPPAGCRGTIGLEAAPVSRQLRKKLALPKGFQGAVVAEVLPGGPAAAAGIRAGDLVEEIGSARIANDCEFVDAAYGRACEPVRIVFRRAGAVSEVTLVPVDQDSFFEQSCRNGVQSGCFRQAWSLWSRNQGTDRERALELFEAACRAGSAEACAQGGLHLLGRTDRAGDTLAVIQRSCDLGSGGGCANLAFLFATGKLVKRDDHRAVRLYVKSCDLGDAMGCYNVGLMADAGRGGPHDEARAIAAYGEACEMGSSSACTNLGFLHENGRGVKKDGARAFALYQRGCDGTSCEPSNLRGCVNVGRAYRDGIGVEKNETRAASVFQNACERRIVTGDVDAEESGSRACSLLGALYLSGDGIARDLAKGRELSELGCGRGDSFGCFNAAAIYAGGTGVDADPERAASFLDQACRAGDGEGCHDLGVAYEKGRGVAHDSRRAAELFRKACELGFQQGCAKAGVHSPGRK